MSRAPRRGPTSLSLGLELAFGVTLLAGATVAGLVFVRHPWPNRLDSLGFKALAADPNSHLWHTIALLGTVPAMVIGIAVAIAASIWRDLWRTAACAVGPLTAVLITEHIAKPLVGRHVYATAGYSYPSGTVTAVAALAAVLLLASPPIFRPLMFVVGAGAIAAVSAAVVAMRWHYPTDALGGACVGVGSVFTFDALVHLPVFWRDRFREHRALHAPVSGRFLEHV